MFGEKVSPLMRGLLFLFIVRNNLAKGIILINQFKWSWTAIICCPMPYLWHIETRATTPLGSVCGHMNINSTGAKTGLRFRSPEGYCDLMHRFHHFVQNMEIEMCLVSKKSPISSIFLLILSKEPRNSKISW